MIKPHEECLGRAFHSSCGPLPPVIRATDPGIGSPGYIPSRTRVLFRLLKLQPIGYGNSRIPVGSKILFEQKSSLWSITQPTNERHET